MKRLGGGWGGGGGGVFFFFKQKTAYEIYQCDWSSDVCSSDLSRETPTEFDDRFAAPDSPETDAVDNDERRRVGQAFLALDEMCRELLTLLTTEPPLSYAEVAETIGKPIGSLGPTRSRCLSKLETLLEATS